MHTNRGHVQCHVVQIMVPGKTNVSLTLSWSTDYDPVAAAQQPGAKQGLKGDADSEVSGVSAQGWCVDPERDLVLIVDHVITLLNMFIASCFGLGQPQ